MKGIVAKGVTYSSNGRIIASGKEISSDDFSNVEDFEKAVACDRIILSNTADPKAEIEKSVSEVAHAVGVNLESETEIDMTPKEQLENSEIPEKESKKRGKRKAK